MQEHGSLSAAIATLGGWGSLALLVRGDLAKDVERDAAQLLVKTDRYEPADEARRYG